MATEAMHVRLGLLFHPALAGPRGSCGSPGGGGGGSGRGGGQPGTTVVLLLGCRLPAGEDLGPQGEEDADGDHPESEDSGQEGSFVSWAIFSRASVPAGGREDRGKAWSLQVEDM